MEINYAICFSIITYLVGVSMAPEKIVYREPEEPKLPLKNTLWHALFGGRS